MISDALKRGSGIDDSVLDKVWTAFGKQVFRKLESCKGVKVPKFGTITTIVQDIDMAVRPLF
jgi:hypothetical protein